MKLLYLPDHYAIEGLYTIVAGMGYIGEIPDVEVRTAIFEEDAIELAKDIYHNIEDVYGYNFVAIFDPDGNEL